MNLGFESWKDVIGVLVIPISLALTALLWPELQFYYRRRAFRQLIFRELSEVRPYPDVARPGMEWWQHLKKDFVHKKIFENVSENRDFILSLPADLVYLISQLWDAMKSHNEDQWLHFLGMLCDPKYDKSGEIKKAHTEWHNLIERYRLLKTGQ